MSWAVNRSRSSSNSTIGWASTISPIVAGTFSISIIRRPVEIVRRIAARSSAAACREMSGSAAVAIDTPKSPIGRYIRRNAYLQPRHRALRLGRGQRRVHEHVDLHGREAERAGPHQPQDLPHARIAEIEDRPIAEALLPEGRPLDRDLADAAEDASRWRWQRSAADRSLGISGPAGTRTGWSRR